MKTTYLFKMNGAWSPLWNLSDEKFFEIQSKEFWGNFCCQIIPTSDSSTLTMKTFKETVEQMLAISYGFVPQTSKPERETEVWAERIMLIQQRVDEIFGGGGSHIRNVFTAQLQLGKAVIVRL